ncbi:hypothetical protein PXD56_15835 [Maribacter sp. SA7]|uniref:hypothetical protein n=1 Tax=Maribacter zhoushanensis TaxID=3030012 RepID=UPI0023EA87F9|nr:hypothetical protein [Maribacter zhoushanensis]MDF4204446.1 hypothetical protein [Maribacter zhoushanensis]
MKKITQTPHIIFWILIPFILLVGFLKPDKTLVINIYDTYLVMDLINLTVLISIIFGILGFGYWVIIKLNRKLLNWLTVIHLILTILGFLILLLIPIISPEIHQDSPGLDFVFHHDLGQIGISTLFLVIIIQLLYLINIITALFRKTD